MKKLSLALIALLAFSFVGCQEWLNIDDPDNPEPEPDPEPNVEAVITLDETSVTLNSGDTYQIQAECEYPITYTSENEYYASVSEEGEVTANFVGSTNIILESESDTQTFEVTIEPVSNLYPEPEIEIGATKEAIIDQFGTPDIEDEETLGFYNYAENTMMLMVLFDEEGLVYAYAVILDVSFEEELDTFLGERYMYVQEQEGVKIYINALTIEETSLIVGSQILEDQFLMAIYEGYTDDPGEKTVPFKTVLKTLGK